MMLRNFAFLVGVSLLAGCAGSPLANVLGDWLGTGDPSLQTDANVQEIGTSIPANALVSVSPDGSRLAYSVYASDDKGTAIFVVEGQKPPRSLGGSHPVRIWWSPDGRRLAYSRVVSPPGQNTAPRLSVFVIDVETGVERTLLDSLSGFQTWLAWAPDGSAVTYLDPYDASSPSKLSVSIVTLADGQPTSLIASGGPLGDLEHAVLWLPDGHHVVYGAPAAGFNNSWNLMTFDLATRTSHFVRRIARSANYTLSSAGTALAFLQVDAMNIAQGGWEEHTIHLNEGTEEVTPFALGAPTIIHHDNGVTEEFTYTPSQISPDLKWCVIEKQGEPLYARELATGRHVQLTSGHAQPVGWTTDSKTLIVSATKGVAHYYRVKVDR